MQRAFRTPRGFTLVELLTVLAIVALISAMLFPVFSQAKRSAKAAVCASNERQIGLAIQAYSTEADEVLPPIRITWEPRTTWYNVVVPYARSKALFACPDNPKGVERDAEGFGAEPDRTLHRSYGINSCAATFYPADGALGPSTPPLALGAVALPSGTVLVAEQTGFASFSPDFLPAALFEAAGQCDRPFVHRGDGAASRANFLFFDGHVRSQTWGSTVLPISSNVWETDPRHEPGDQDAACSGTTEGAFTARSPLCGALR